MDISKLLDEDTFLSMHPMIQRVPKELIHIPDIVRQYQGYVVETVRFKAYDNEVVSIDEEISISIPAGYPISLPIVFILNHGKVINLGAEFHFYTNTGQLCLGNSWDVRKELLRDSTLNNLVDSLVIPHIAGATFKLLQRKAFPQGEYAHGLEGKLEGVAEFFSIPLNEKRILDVLSFLNQSKRVANKMQCPFGCGVEYGKCHCRGNYQDLKTLFPHKEVSALIKEIRMRRVVMPTLS